MNLRRGCDRSRLKEVNSTASLPVVHVEEITNLNFGDHLLAPLSRLLGQLSSSASPVTADDILDIVHAPATRLLVARDGDEGEILGTLTLVLFRILSGVRGIIEDVVVDEAARGRGIAQALLDEAMCLGREAGARTVDLTSNPKRDAANRLYQRYGFEQRETNVYRFLP